MAESAFRQAMLISQGDLRVFWSNWLVGGLVTLALLMLFWPAISALLIKVRGKPIIPVLTDEEAVAPKK